MSIFYKTYAYQHTITPAVWLLTGTAIPNANKLYTTGEKDPYYHTYTVYGEGRAHYKSGIAD